MILVHIFSLHECVCVCPRSHLLVVRSHEISTSTLRRRNHCSYVNHRVSLRTSSCLFVFPVSVDVVRRGVVVRPPPSSALLLLRCCCCGVVAVGNQQEILVLWSTTKLAKHQTFGRADDVNSELTDDVFERVSRMN